MYDKRLPTTLYITNRNTTGVPWYYAGEAVADVVGEARIFVVGKYVLESVETFQLQPVLVEV